MIALRYSTKAQLQMIETILVLFVFLLILVMGIYFYYQYTFAGIKEESFEISEKQATTLISSFTNLPELSCINEVDCIDIIKLVNFRSTYSMNTLYYNLLFKNKKITISQIYPETSGSNCFFQNAFPLQCNSILIYSNVPNSYKTSYTISMPINLFYPTLNKYSLGKVSIEVYT